MAQSAQGGGGRNGLGEGILRNGGIRGGLRGGDSGRENISWGRGNWGSNF